MASFFAIFFLENLRILSFFAISMYLFHTYQAVFHKYTIAHPPTLPFAHAHWCVLDPETDKAAFQFSYGINPCSIL